MDSVTMVVLNTVSWATASTAIVMVAGIPLAYLLARREFVGKGVVSALVSLPMVLPPTAVGYLLLRLLADQGPLGRDALGFDPDVLLTWRGVVIACSVMSLPLVIRTARVSFEAVNPRLEAVSRTLGRGRVCTFLTVTLPLAGRGIVAAAILGFTRAMGEFGASVIVAGNIPGRTQTLASAIYSAQQSGNAWLGNRLLMVALALGFSAILLAEWLSRPPRPSMTNGGRS